MGLFRVPWLMLLPWWKKTCLLALLFGLHNCLVLLHLLQEALDPFSPLFHLVILLSLLQETALSVVSENLLRCRPMGELVLLLVGLQDKTCWLS